MLTSILPKFLFEEEDVVTLKDKGISFEEGTVKIGNYKVPSYRFRNLTETQVIDKLHTNLNESIETEKSSYASKVASVLFLKIRQVSSIKDKDLRQIGAITLLSAANALADIDVRTASRFMSLIRAIN